MQLSEVQAYMYFFLSISPTHPNPHVGNTDAAVLKQRVNSRMITVNQSYLYGSEWELTRGVDYMQQVIANSVEL